MSAGPALAAGPALRWSRAAVLAAVALAAGTLAHLSADGRLPGLPAMGMLYAGTVALCAAVLGRPASRLTVVGLLVGGQTLAHVVLTGLAGHRGDGVVTSRAALTAPSAPVPAPAGGRGGSYFDVAYGAGAAPARPVVPGFVQHVVADLTGHLGAQAPMALAHLAAAVLVGLWLAAGERALWLLVLVLAAGPVVAARLRSAYLVLARSVVAAVARLRRPAPLLVLPSPSTLPLPARWVYRRGPPVAA